MPIDLGGVDQRASLKERSITLVHQKRKITAAIALLPLLISCRALGHGDPPKESKSEQLKRFDGIGLILVTDAVAGAEMLGVEFFADDGSTPFFAQSRMTQSSRGISSYPGGYVANKVRVVWRKTYNTFRAGGNIRYGGEIAGDYTISVAERIPDAVLQDIRAKGGALRLKFRLKPDGVLFGWDIERAPAEERKHSIEEIRAKNLYFPSEYLMVGGDFTDTRY